VVILGVSIPAFILILAGYKLLKALASSLLDEAGESEPRREQSATPWPWVLLSLLAILGAIAGVCYVFHALS
ncbi:MAG: hypothetical protein R6V85_13195, partial [Polyangia bacterium]